MPEAVRIEGLTEFRKELRKVAGKDGLDALKAVNVKVAEMIVERTKPKMSKKSTRSAASLKAAKTGNASFVRGGGKSAPMFGGVEFGSYRNQSRATRRGPVKGWNQFDPWKGNGSGAGYFLYDTVRSSSDEVIKMYRDGMIDIARDAFPEGSD